jgi:hypothetical protein
VASVGGKERGREIERGREREREEEMGGPSPCGIEAV